MLKEHFPIYQGPNQYGRRKGKDGVMDARSRGPEAPDPADEHKQRHQTRQNDHDRRNRHQQAQAGRVFKVQAWHAKGG